MPWFDKYAPGNVKDIIGQDVSAIIKYAKSSVKGKACLIYGPSGCGKTSSVQALAKGEGFDLVEFNASSVRDGESVSNVIGNALVTGSLFGRKVVLFDDVDSMSGVHDRGGMSELVDCIKSARNPIFLTALDIWDPKIRSLKSCCELVEFSKVRTSSIRDLLKNICAKESVRASDSVLYSIASHASGDVRAAINDLEMLSVNNSEITEHDISVMGYREKPRSIFDGLQVLFKTNNFSEAVYSLDDVDMDFSTKFLWVSENVPVEFKDSFEIAKAFNYLSRADVFNGRIMKREYWRFLVYVNALMTAGVSFSKRNSYGFVRYSNPSRIMKLGQTKSSRETRKSIATKIKPFVNASMRKTFSEVIPFLKFMQKDLSSYDLSDDEFEFIKK